MNKTFYFMGKRGHVDSLGFVRWAGMSFQIEACSKELRAAIDRA